MIKNFKALKKHQGFMRYFKNTSWVFGEKILRMLVGLFVGIWVARYLGPKQFGLFSYVQSFVGLFTVIASLGLDSIVVRELVKNENRKDELIGTAFWLKLMGAFSALGFLAIAVGFTSNDKFTNTLVFIIASTTIFQSFNIVDMYFQAKVMSKYAVYSNTISLLISSLIKIYLIITEAPLIWFAWSILFDSFILALGYIYFYLKINKSFIIKNLKFKKSTATYLLKDSWPLIIGAVAASIYMKIDQVMIKEMLNEESVGYYSIAVRLSELWLFITVALTNSLSPLIISAKSKNNGLYTLRLQEMYNLLSKIAIVISVFVFICSKHIVSLLYGDQYSKSSEILDIYIWSTIFVFLSNGSWSYYINENLEKIAGLRLVYGAIINITLNIFFIPYFGLIGAAYSTLISYSISSYFINYFYKKTKLNFTLQTISILNIFKIKTWKNPVKI